jgi:hypothetical protein
MATDVGTFNPVTSLEGRLSTLNITSSTVIKASPGRVFKVSVVVAGSTTPGTINDCTTTGAAAASNQIGTAPNALGTIDFNWPMASGIVVVPQGGQTLAITWE